MACGGASFREHGLGLPLAWRPHEAAAEEIEARAAKHLAFQHFEAIDVPLDRAGAPGQGHPRFDRLIVLVQPLAKRCMASSVLVVRALQPGIEVLGLPLAHEVGKVLREVDGLGDLGLLRGSWASCWASASVRFASRRSTSQVARRGVKGWHDGLGHDAAGAASRRRWRGGRPWACRKRLGIGRDAAIAARVAPLLEVAKQPAWRYGSPHSSARGDTAL